MRSDSVVSQDRAFTSIYEGSPPRVSIVLPTRNRAPLLRGAIESCLSQTFTDLELIVVDDGSEDSTAAVVRSFDDPRVVYVSQDHGGLPIALNTGFRQSRGELLTWTSDDNRYHSNALATMVTFLEAHPEVAIMYAGAKLIDETGQSIGVWPLAPPKMLDQFNCVGACFLYRRKVYEVLGDYDPLWNLAEDYEYWLRARNRFAFSTIDQALYDLCVHNDCLTSTRWIEVRLKVLQLKQKYVWKSMSFWERRRNLGAGYLLLSHLLYERGHPHLALRNSLVSIVVDPFRGSAYKGVIRGLMPRAFWKVLRNLRDRVRQDSKIAGARPSLQ